MDKWAETQLHPVAPKIVKDGPVHEEIYQGDNLLEHGGLEELPVPISTPGFDNAPYLTCATFADELLEWEGVYNTVRPHQALGYLTPLKFLEQSKEYQERRMCH